MTLGGAMILGLGLGFGGAMIIGSGPMDIRLELAAA